MENSLTKKSSKFDNFLRKKLDDQTYHRVRGYEACIACWEKESKAFKYVVLTDEHVLLTENPPRTITQVVCLRNVLSINLVDDYPDFLSGSERLNTLHLTVQHLVASSKLSKDRGGSGSRREAPSGVQQSESAPSVLAVASRNSSSVVGPDSSTSSARTSVHFDSATDASDDESAHEPLQRKLSASAPSGSLRSLLSVGDDCATDDAALPASATVVGSSSAGDDGSRSPVIVAAGLHQRRQGDALSRAANSPVMARSASTDGTDALRAASPAATGRPGFAVASLHLYMLNSESPMFSLMRYAADNCAIRSTLMMDQEYCQRIQQHERRCTNEEKVEAQFITLVHELLTPRNSMETIFNLTRELKTAAEKDFFLKKLFWKNETLFSFFVAQLQMYLPRSRLSLEADTAGRMRRADELELVILITQTLELMFRETEIFPARLKVLAAHSGRLAAQLAAALTCQPELPPRYQLPSTKAARLLVQTKADELHWSADEELQELCDEYVRHATAVVFELVLIAQQSYWGTDEGSFLNVGWMVRALERHDASRYFTEKLIHQSLSLMQPSRGIVLSPLEAVLVFQQFTVLQTLINHSKHFAAHVRSRYREEFKYYIRTHTLAEKLPQLYPISHRALQLMGDVIARVVTSTD